jgi:2-polyprenyl-3-methyl-5-hydroxy-6-metoxy-1,4-benzoquinol methylase
MQCSVCSEGKLSAYYQGRIRLGKFPNVIDNAMVYRCDRCQVQMFDGYSVNYESSEYRDLVDADSSPASYYRQHDQEQPERLTFLDITKLRNSVCIDVGAGGGSFLDLVKGFAAGTVAVEPTEAYHQALKAKGHHPYPYAKDAMADWQGKADLVTSFSVLEHIPEPVAFLHDMVSLAKKGGTVILTTPNSEDWLIDFIPEYKAFFYRVVHKWYFNAHALKLLAERVGLTDVEVRYYHRFSIANALNWIRDRKPTGNSGSFFSSSFEAAFRQELIENGKADYICFKARKK